MLIDGVNACCNSIIAYVRAAVIQTTQRLPAARYPSPVNFYCLNETDYRRLLQRRNKLYSRILGPYVQEYIYFLQNLIKRLLHV